jgi:hypothetical protein
MWRNETGRMIMANEQAGQKKQADVEVNARPKGEEQSVIAGQEDRSRKWSQLVAQAWADEKLKQRLTDSPAAVLQEHGIEVPTGVEIRVVENTDKICYLTLPARPSDELTPSQLSSVAGGFTPIGAFASYQTRSAEEVNHSEFSIVKLLDAATPKL